MLRLLGLFLTVTAMAAFADEPQATLPIGSPAPDFSLPGVDGKTHTVKEYAGSKILVIVFTCNHCPTAQLYESRIEKLADDYRGKGVELVAIEPNNAKAIRLDELGYTDVSDSLEEMKIRAAYRHFSFPYLYDGETQSVSRAYGRRLLRTFSSSIRRESFATRGTSTIISVNHWSPSKMRVTRSKPCWRASQFRWTIHAYLAVRRNGCPRRPDEWRSQRR
jgi:peroxiredoxin